MSYEAWGYAIPIIGAVLMLAATAIICLLGGDE
ncbi:hypothetical protein ACVIRO_001242 [Rhizobium ruizarguesonis]